MLLTDEEISAVSYKHFAEVAHVHDNDMDWDKWANDFARAIEAAILAKLASAELPEPELHDGITVTAKGKYKSTEDGYTADQLRQAYAQGAAAQLDRLKAAEKDAERYRFALDDREFAVCEFNNNRRHWVPIRDNASIDKAMEASK